MKIIERYVDIKVEGLFEEVIRTFDLRSGDLDVEGQLTVDKFKEALKNFIIMNGE